jgi:heat shock protein HslJ
MRLSVCLLLALLAVADPSPAARAQQVDGAARWRVGDELVGTRWRAQTIKGVPVADPSQATIEFLPGDHVRGQAACNRYVGPFATRSDRITLGPLRVSRLDCGDQTPLLVALITELRRANRVVLSPDRLELQPSTGPASVFLASP